MIKLIKKKNLVEIEKLQCNVYKPFLLYMAILTLNIDLISYIAKRVKMAFCTEIFYKVLELQNKEMLKILLSSENIIIEYNN